MNKRMKKTLHMLRYIFLVSLITLILLEITSCIYLSSSQKLGYGDLLSLKEKYIADLEPDVSIQHDVMFYNQKFQLHPYFAYTLAPKSKLHINNVGYPCDKDYPYWADKDEFVVGIFGGSVAAQMFWFYRKNKVMTNVLLPILKDKGYEKVTVLNFSLAGGKHPISLFAFEYYISTLDMAIFIEGFNECHQFSSNISVTGYPGDFPKWAYWKALAEKHYSPYTIQIIGRLENKKNQRRKITQSVTTSILGRSMFVHLLWKTYIDRVEKSEHRLREKLLKEQNETLTFENITPIGLTLKERTNIYFKKYESCIEMTHIVGKKFHVPCFFIIQPNQYFHGSKPLSKKESDKFVEITSLEKIVNRFYPRVIEMYRYLSSKGIGAIDLTNVFDKTHETAYIDTYCHLNELGKKIFGKAILEKIIKLDKPLKIVPKAENRLYRLIKSGNLEYPAKT